MFQGLMEWYRLAVLQTMLLLKETGNVLALGERQQLGRSLWISKPRR
jgi:hypothetical protein